MAELDAESAVAHYNEEQGFSGQTGFGTADPTPAWPFLPKAA